MKPIETQLRKEMVEASRPYAEQFILLKKWRMEPNNSKMMPHTELQPFSRIWEKYINWLTYDIQTDPKFAGPNNQFYHKVTSWVEKKGKPAQYRPNEKLITLWNQELVEEQVGEQPEDLKEEEKMNWQSKLYPDNDE